MRSQLENSPHPRSGPLLRQAPDKVARQGDAGKTILLITDDTGLSERLCETVAHTGHSVYVADCAERAAKLSRKNSYRMILCDLSFNDASGLDLVQKLAQSRTDCPVVALATFSQAPLALEAMKMGATDFILLPAMPCDFEALLSPQ